MNRVKLGLSGLNTLQLVEKAQRVVTQMTGNPSFMGPVPALLVIQTAAADLNDANNAALGGAHQAIIIRNDKYEVLLNYLRLLGAYVQNASNGVESVITSSGFEVVSPRTPAGLPPAISALTAVTSGYAGSAELKWKSLKGKADTYVVYATQTDPASSNPQWDLIGYSSKAAFTAENLSNHNQYYWFCVVALNSAGESVMSDPAKCMVL